MIGSPYTTIPGDRKRRVFKLLHHLTCSLITMETMGSDGVTFLPGFGNDISGRFAHHLGDVQRTVSLFSYGDGAEHCFRLNLQHNTIRHQWSPTPALLFFHLIEKVCLMCIYSLSPDDFSVK